MLPALRLKRDVASDIAAYSGVEGEIVINTDSEAVVVMDGVQAGGFEQARADLSNVSIIPDQTARTNALSGQYLALNAAKTGFELRSRPYLHSTVDFTFTAAHDGALLAMEPGSSGSPANRTVRLPRVGTANGGVPAGFTVTVVMHVLHTGRTITVRPQANDRLGRTADGTAVLSALNDAVTFVADGGGTNPSSYGNWVMYRNGGGSGGSTTLPANAAGFLKNNGSGTLSWSTVAVAEGGTGATTISNARSNLGFKDWVEQNVSGATYDIGTAIDDGHRRIFSLDDSSAQTITMPDPGTLPNNYECILIVRFHSNTKTIVTHDDSGEFLIDGVVRRGDSSSFTMSELNEYVHVRKNGQHAEFWITRGDDIAPVTLGGTGGSTTSAARDSLGIPVSNDRVYPGTTTPFATQHAALDDEIDYIVMHEGPNTPITLDRGIRVRTNYNNSDGTANSGNHAHFFLDAGTGTWRIHNTGHTGNTHGQQELVYTTHANAVPAYSASNNGQILKVVNGALTWTRGGGGEIKTIFHGNVDIATANVSQALPAASSSIIKNPLNDTDIDDDDWILISADINVTGYSSNPGGVDGNSNDVTDWVRGKEWKDGTAVTVGGNDSTNSIAVLTFAPLGTSNRRSMYIGKLASGDIWIQANVTNSNDARPLTILHFKSGDAASGALAVAEGGTGATEARAARANIDAEHRSSVAQNWRNSLTANNNEDDNKVVSFNTTSASLTYTMRTDARVGWTARALKEVDANTLTVRVGSGETIIGAANDYRVNDAAQDNVVLEDAGDYVEMVYRGGGQWAVTVLRLKRFEAVVTARNTASLSSTTTNLQTAWVNKAYAINPGSSGRTINATTSTSNGVGRDGDTIVFATTSSSTSFNITAYSFGSNTSRTEAVSTNTDIVHLKKLSGRWYHWNEIE